MKRVICLLSLASLSLSGCGGESTDSGEIAAPSTPQPPTLDPGKVDWPWNTLPFADTYNLTAQADGALVRGRLVQEGEDDIGDLEVTPFSQLAQDEITYADVDIWLVRGEGDLVYLDTVSTGDEGYFEARVQLPEELAPGSYALWFGYKRSLVGVSRVKVLDRDRVAPVVRSDVDQTYLDTDLSSNTTMVKLMFDAGAERAALPAMDTVYQQLRQGGDRPITFLSGSPRFFKRTIEARMYLGGVEQDGLVLKPFKDLIAENVLDLSFDEVLGDLKEQVGYKLYWLLKLRLDLPKTTPEILMGDDSEADVIVYALYTHLLQHDLTLVDLKAELDRLNVSDTWQRLLLPVAEQVQMSAATPPVAIYINQTEYNHNDYAVEDWQVDGLVRHHEGAWPLSLDLYEEGWMSDADLLQVYGALLNEGFTGEDLKQQAERAPFLLDETRNFEP